MSFVKPRRTVAAAALVSLALIPLGAGAAVAAPAHPANSPHSAYKVRTLHRVGKAWSLEVTSILKNANKACDKADHLFYKKPKKGYVYVVVQYTGKKLSGGKKQDLGEGVITNLLAKDGKQYGQLYGIVAPHDASSSKSVGKGKKSSGGFTYEVKKSDVKAGHLEAIAEGTTSSDLTAYYFAT